MKMRTLLLLKCASPFLVCVCGCVCVHQFSKVSLHALSPKTLCYLHICLLKFVSDLILPFIPNFLFRFPLEVKMFFKVFIIIIFWHELSHVPSGLT